MICHTAQHLISAERDGALSSDERAGLDQHLAICGDCRRFRSILAEASNFEKNETARIRVPDSERAWQDIRREIRLTRHSSTRSAAALRWGLPAGALAAVAAAAVWLTSDRTDDFGHEVVHVMPTGVEYVETPSAAASMVYVDDESGWVVVWATNDSPDKGSPAAK